MGAILHLACPVVKQFSSLVNTSIHGRTQGSLDQQYPVHSPIVTHLCIFHCFCVVEQATLLEESGDPEKALDELLKKEAKIVLHPALLFCNQPFLLISVELLLDMVVRCHLRLGCLTSQAFSSLN